MTEISKTKQIAKKGNQESQVGLSAKSLDDLNVGQLRDYAKVLVESELVPLKRPEDVIVAVLTGRSMGLTATASLNNIYPINGRGTLGVHLIKALLLTGGVKYETIHDYVPMYGFAMKDGEGKVDTTVPPLIDFFREPKEYEARSKSIKDYGSLIKFTRKLRLSDGSWTEMTEYGKFTWGEAKLAGLTDKKGDMWKKYPRQMVTSRAFTYGARLIAPDLLMGLYETSEMLDVKDIQYTIEEDDVTPVSDIKDAVVEETSTD